MTAKRTSGESESVPLRMPEGTPTPYLHPDQHSWILQSVGEMRESIGALKHAVDTLTTETREQRTKLESISHKVYAATVIGGLVLAGLAWVIANLSGIRALLEAIGRSPTP